MLPTACLGAQLLARALGAQVSAGDEAEIGWLAIEPTPAAEHDRLFRHLRRPAGVYHWHVDEFDLPAGAVRLAASELFRNQAFRAGEAWGVQFHPEVDLAQFELWIANHPGAAAAHGIDEDALREEVRRGSADEVSRAFRVGLFDAYVEYASQ